MQLGLASMAICPYGRKQDDLVSSPTCFQHRLVPTKKPEAPFFRVSCVSHLTWHSNLANISTRRKLRFARLSASRFSLFMTEVFTLRFMTYLQRFFDNKKFKCNKALKELPHLFGRTSSKAMSKLFHGMGPSISIARCLYPRRKLI